jgi:hypothetical protein
MFPKNPQELRLQRQASVSNVIEKAASTGASMTNMKIGESV